MDNSNNNNSTNNPFPPITPQSGANPPPPPNPAPTFLGDQPTSYPNATWPPTPPTPSTPTAWNPDPLPSQPIPSPLGDQPTSYPLSNPTGQAIPPLPLGDQPTSYQQNANPIPTYTPPISTPLNANPQPQFAPATPSTYPSAETYPSAQNSPQDNPWNPSPQPPPPEPSSPLDNPWGAPLQAPPIDGLTQPSVPQPPPPEPSSPPPWSPLPETSQPMEEAQPITSLDNQPTSLGDQPTFEPAPTDLSHLINNNGSAVETIPPANGGAETLVAPANEGIPDVPTIPTEAHNGFPKWIIGVGVGLLIIVTGASAYFILGIGQSPKTTSIPAETVPVSQQVKPPAPIPTPIATGSANFGELQGSGTQQATSAADLLRQRQQQGR